MRYDSETWVFYNSKISEKVTEAKCTLNKNKVSINYLFQFP
jgi:hypothetical protein